VATEYGKMVKNVILETVIQMLTMMISKPFVVHALFKMAGFALITATVLPLAVEMR